MDKMDLALNNQQGLICHNTQPNQIIYGTRLLTIAVLQVIMFEASCWLVGWLVGFYGVSTLFG